MYHTTSPKLEPLEARTLLAGVTVLIHGHQGTIHDWITSAADAIAKRAGESQTSQYVMKVGKVSGDLAVKSITLEHGPGLRESTSGEVVIKLDWTDLDNGDYSTTEVGEAVAQYLLESHGPLPALASLPIHLIGHSRGGSMVSAISRYLGGAGVWVDQNTFLDPVAVEDFFGFGYDDLPLRVYSNVIFADDYWRDDGSPFDADPDGKEVDGAHNVDLEDSVQEHHVISAHMGVTAYYHATIDLKAKLNRDSPVFSDWYGDGNPKRNETGFRFSRLGGGSRPRDGLSEAFGGTGERRGTGDDLPQWSNVANVRTPGGRSFTLGKKIKVKLNLQDGDSAAGLTLYLDRDRNPFNGEFARTMRQATVNDVDDVTTAGFGAASGGVSPGRYYICARVTDSSGAARFSYSKRITLEAPQAARVQALPARAGTNPGDIASAPAIAKDILQNL
jgi:hypothetical protein